MLWLAAMFGCTILLRIFLFFSHDVSDAAGGHVGLHHNIAFFLLCFSLLSLLKGVESV